MSDAQKQKVPWVPRWEYFKKPEYLQQKEEREILRQKEQIFLEEEKKRQSF
jgi:hypothetical protein